MTELPPLPLIGRAAELDVLRAALDRAAAGRGGTIILAGEGGAGKTRLAAAAAEEAQRRGFSTARGRAYPLEAGVPYALFADALLPVLRPLSDLALNTMVRGGIAELAYVFPTLRQSGSGLAASDDSADVKSRVLWTMAQLVAALAARKPLLLVMDDVHAADAASLELLHFLARQSTSAGMLIVCTYNESERRTSGTLRELENSLLSLGVATVLRVRPLDRADTVQLVAATFHVPLPVCTDFANLLFDSTRGNAFFVQETLRTLAETRRLYHDGARWHGWQLESLEVPATVREAVLGRMDRLTPEARTVADLAATLGTRAAHTLLEELSGLPAARLFTALDELRRGGVIVEQRDGDDVAYDFTHPMLGQALYAELGLARARTLHAAIAAALERRYGPATTAHADELAYHFARADARAHAPQAIHYLITAGESALRRHASREAADYLTRALEQLDALGVAGAEAAAERARVRHLIARARQRLGEYDAAIAEWRDLLADAEASGRTGEIVTVRRGIALACFWSGRYGEALEHLSAGTAEARALGDEVMEARLRLALASCQHELGNAAAAQEEAERAHAIATARGDAALLARTHRALLLLRTWTGPARAAREHGARAVEYATAAHEDEVLFSSHWALAVLEGLTGRSERMAEHIEAAERIAEAARAPLFWLATAELWIEFSSSVGDWDRGIAIGERAIGLARSLNQKRVLTRLLVWTALIHFGRGELDTGRAYVDEAWRLAGADQDGAPLDVHSVVPAHIGRAAYHMALGDHRTAIAIGERGLDVADRTGYVFWAIHRLLPIVAESYCHLGDIEGAQRCEARLRRDSQRLDHRLGLAWADTCRAIVEWLRGELDSAVTLLRAAAASLEAIPVVPDAARVRRQLAGRLADVGERDAAIAELRHVHEIFVRLGAEPELNKARGQFREIGAKPPTRTAGEGSEALTGREVEIARLVAERRSNKAIARALDISPRTVSTHLSNIFRKLGVASRAELADAIRAGVLDAAER